MKNIHLLTPVHAYILAALMTCLLPAHAAINIQVEQWGVFELTLPGPTKGNPFTEVQLSANFTNGVKTLKANGFYDGKGLYKIRFMPDSIGNWGYITHSNRWELTGQQGNFVAVAPSPENHGPVSVAHTFHFSYADGTPFKPIGTTSYTWTHRPDKIEEQTLSTLASSPFNKIRMCVFPQTHGTKGLPPKRFPFAGKPTKPDYSRFNPEFFKHLEKRLSQLQQLNIEADLILFHPYDDKHIWGLDNMAPAVEERYLRYIVARLSAYRNVWWSMANEYDFIRTKTEEDWDRLFKIVADSDPHQHLRSIHNGKKIYNHTKPWVTHVSMQNGLAVTSPGSAQLYRDVYNKPIVYDEVEYEGNYASRWAQLSGQELVHRFWAGSVVGTYVGHSEFFVEPGDSDKFVWLGQGGTLKGESPPRLKFLRTILEEGPANGIEPTDKWWNPNIGGQLGEYYLIYFGHKTPKSWPFTLPAKGLENGMAFNLEIIDTWGMTITPVEGGFEIERKDRYSFTDTHNRSIPLPQKPAIALRITRVIGSH